MSARKCRGFEAATTNNRMELTAAIGGLGALSTALRGEAIHLDSKYVLQGITEWLPNWKARGWLAAARQPVKNQDLWQLLTLDAKPLRLRRYSMDLGEGAFRDMMAMSTALTGSRTFEAIDRMLAVLWIDF